MLKEGDSESDLTLFEPFFPAPLFISGFLIDCLRLDDAHTSHLLPNDHFCRH